MKQNYRDNYYGSILDPIHGDIKLSEIEKWCISTPLFRRLRNVKQNTFLYYVFPSANHTRFEHSIGVMHIAGKIFDACRENFATGLKKNKKYKNAEPSAFFDLNKLGERKEEIYYQELRLAALLHDIGHGPLSHLFDDFLMSKGRFFELIENDPLFSKYRDAFEKICVKDKIEHEHMSCLFVISIISQLKSDAKIKEKFSDPARALIKKLSIERIVKLIEPKFESKADFTDDQGNNYNTFFSRIITAFPIDSDRMDYLLRDSFFSGVNYGFYDINRIFASFMAIEMNNEIFLTFKESGIDSILRFIQSRTHLYNQVYFHKTNRAANTMLAAAVTHKKTEAFKLLNQDKYKSISDIEDFYIRNSDDYFIKKTVNKEITATNIEKEILEELQERRLFKRVYEHKIILLPKTFGKEKDIEKIKDDMAGKLAALSAKKIFAYVDIYKNEVFKDSDKGVKIAIKDKKSGVYSFDARWESLNQEFENANMLSFMLRVYLRRTFTNSEAFKEMRKKVTEQIKPGLEKLEKIK